LWPLKLEAFKLAFFLEQGLIFFKGWNQLGGLKADSFPFLNIN